MRRWKLLGTEIYPWTEPRTSRCPYGRKMCSSTVVCPCPSQILHKKTTTASECASTKWVGCNVDRGSTSTTRYRGPSSLWLCQLSLNALAGTAQGEALVVRTLFQNKTMLILVDSCSSHSFISLALVQSLNVPIVPMCPQQVRLANGDTLVTDQWVPQLAWWLCALTWKCWTCQPMMQS